MDLGRRLMNLAEDATFAANITLCRGPPRVHDNTLEHGNTLLTIQRFAREIRRDENVHRCTI